jgi:hypothetical protein
VVSPDWLLALDPLRLDARMSLAASVFGPVDGPVDGPEKLCLLLPWDRQRSAVKTGNSSARNHR